MISIDYDRIQLIENQLHDGHQSQGDRPFWTDRPGLGWAEPSHAAVAWLDLGHPGRATFPGKGGHPPYQGAAHAHRSSFVRMPLRQSLVVVMELLRRTLLCRLWVGVRCRACSQGLLAAAGVRGKFIGFGEGKGKRTSDDAQRSFSGWTPSLDRCTSSAGFIGAGAPALSRAPALFSDVGCRP